MNVDSSRTIDKPDFALLNAVSLDQWAAYLLAGEAPMEDIMDVPSHGLGEHELAEHFFRLWRDGLIECSAGESQPAITPDFELARQQFIHTEHWPPKGPLALVYRLSNAGGALWEYFACPDWSKFFAINSDSNSRECALTSSDRHLVELLRKCHYYHPPPLEGTDSWKILKPWAATYWKMLPIGHQLTFRFESYDWPAQYCDLYSYTEVQNAYECVAESWRTWRKSFEEICKENFG
jgi:hypothetical protein